MNWFRSLGGFVRLAIISVVAVVGLAVIIMLFAPNKTSASHCWVNGRACWYGYFFNAYDGGAGVPRNNVISSPALLNVWNATNLADTLWMHLGGCPGGGLWNQNAQNATGAAFIILTMLGAPPGTPKNQACARFVEWRDTYLFPYQNAGLINFDLMYSFDINTRSSITDVAYYHSAGTARSIVFYDPYTRAPIYAIKKDCANPVGVLSPLRRLGQPPSGTANYVCHTVSGTAVDPDNTGAALPVRVYDRPIGTAGAVYRQVNTNPATRAFSVDTWEPPLSANDFGAHRYYVYVINITSTGATDPTDPNPWYPLAGGSPTASLSCPPPTSCGSASTNPTAPESGMSTQVTVNVSYGPITTPYPTSPTYRMQVSITDTSGGTSYFSTLSAPYTASATGANATVTFVPPAGGVYVARWSFVGPGIVASGCAQEFSVYNKPYVRVYGGDVLAGASFSPCAGGPATGIIKAFNRGGPPNNYEGSGVQVAAVAYQAIDQFVSASIRTSPGPATGLTFANTSGVYGGDYASGPCLPDFWSLTTIPGATVQPGGYIVTGRTLTAGGKQDIFVDGDAYITGNIIYAGSWSVNLTGNDIPSFRLIVRSGNIYISRGVTQLDGIYIALPAGDGSRGMIYTCANAAVNGPPSPAEAASNCNTQLRVNGAFIARQVKLVRTANSLKDAVANEQSTTSRAAEIFTYTPEVWIALPQFLSPTGTDYDGITSLPPVL